MSEDACQVCEAGYLLNHKDKLCYETCEDGFVSMTWGEDDEYGECWKDCGSEEETSSINDFNNPLECIECNADSVIPNCEICVSKDFGQSSRCISCMNSLVPNTYAKHCVQESCKRPNEDDPTLCDICDEGYYMIVDTTQCVEECPAVLRTEDETMTCEQLCTRGQFIGEDKKCKDCSASFPNCEICSEEECLACEGANTFDYGQKSCSPCELWQIPTFNGDKVTCTACHDLFDYCSRCTLNDHGKPQCDECLLGDEPLHNQCKGCGDKMFLDMNSKVPESNTCEYCENRIRNCYQCQYFDNETPNGWE